LVILAASFVQLDAADETAQDIVAYLLMLTDS
jgi:hypothetical protein